MINEKKTSKFWKIVVILIILFFPVKWFVYPIIYNQFLSLSIKNIDEVTLRQKFIEIAAFNGAPSTYATYINNGRGNARALALEEVIQPSSSNLGKIGQSFVTLNSKYLYIEKGAEPVWKSCLYKDEGDNMTLLKIPGNCQTWTRFYIVASNKSPDILIYDGSSRTHYYVVQDNGVISVYTKP